MLFSKKKILASITILHSSGKNFCTSSYWTASGSSTIGWHFRLGFGRGPLAPEAGLGLQPQILVAPPYVFPDVLPTIVDANVHLLERVAHIIMSHLSNVCMLSATNRKPVNLTHGQTTDVAQPQSFCLCVFLLLETATQPKNTMKASFQKVDRVNEHSHMCRK